MFEFWITAKFYILDYCGLVGLRQCLSPQPGLGTQPYYEAPDDLCIEIVETQWLNIR